jgi:hypothetical protein
MKADTLEEIDTLLSPSNRIHREDKTKMLVDTTYATKIFDEKIEGDYVKNKKPGRVLKAGFAHYVYGQYEPAWQY